MVILLDKGERGREEGGRGRRTGEEEERQRVHARVASLRVKV